MDIRKNDKARLLHGRKHSSLLVLALLFCIPVVVYYLLPAGMGRLDILPAGWAHGLPSSMKRGSDSEIISEAEVVQDWLQRLDDLSDRFGLCGTWQKEYVKLHSAIRSGVYENGTKVPTDLRRFVVFYCNKEKEDPGGMGDRAIGMTTALGFAIATDRAFLVYWPGVGRILRPMPGGIDWTYDQAMRDELAIPDGVPENVTWGNLPPLKILLIRPDVALLSLMNTGATDDSLRSVMSDTQSVRFVVIRTNRGLLTNILRTSERLRSAGLMQPHATGCFLRNLLRPSPSIIRAIAPIASRLLAPQTFNVAVHSRFGDEWFNVTDEDTTLSPSPYTESQSSMSSYLPPSHGFPTDVLLRRVKSMLECAHLLASYWMPLPQQFTIYFATESSQVKAAVKKLLPDRVLVHEGALDHMNMPEGVDSTVAEWFLLAMCNQFVISTSGLSRTAAYYGIGEKHIFQFPRATITPSQAANLSEGARSGSGSGVDEIVAMAKKTWGEHLYENNVDPDTKQYCKPWRPSTLEDLQNWSGM